MELLEALKVIKEICLNNECSSCPLRTHNGINCMVTQDCPAPAYWALNDEVPRLFK